MCPSSRSGEGARVDRRHAVLLAGRRQLVSDPEPAGTLWLAAFRDPAGNVVGLWHDGPR